MKTYSSKEVMELIGYAKARFETAEEVLAFLRGIMYSSKEEK